ncbi:efflux RND transporter permease subunit [Candidatus Saccharibacteria bacterium]|nr:efflux RND transporter permease subunit [Candidatus Saccharibacteria bacterium]
MSARSKRSSPITDHRAKLLPRLSLFFFDRPRMTAIIGLALLVFGIASYTTLLKREGFPSITVPYSLVNGAYLVDDAAKVDADIGQPVSEVITKLPDVKAVDTQSGANFYNIAIQYKDGTDSKAGNAEVEKAVKEANVLPPQATSNFQPLTIGVNERGDDMLVAFYSVGTKPVSTEDLFSQSQKAAKFLTNSGSVPLAANIEALDPFVRGTDPATGQMQISQKLFDRFGIRLETKNQFYTSVVIGIKGVKGFDVLELDKQVNAGLSKLNSTPEFAGYYSNVSYSIAPSINDQIEGLQQSLIEALLAILLISAIMIALRASLITVGAMLLVLFTTLAVLFVIGYSLNTITLFSLILSLSLIVDDTIIMVEAIDAQRRSVKRARLAVEYATQKISRVMVAATLTATFAFAPLLFVGGILGSFIRAIPVTVITSLLVSLLVALIFIPLLARFLLLRPKQLGVGNEGKHESVAHHAERFIANTLSRPIIWTRHVRKRQFGLGIAAVLVGFGFIIAGGLLFSKVTFNIFAPTKDSDEIGVQMTFAPNKSIDEVQAVADEADALVGRALGVNFKQASYYNTGTTQNATLTTGLISFKDRDVTAPELSDQIEATLSRNIADTQFKVGPVDVGPPSSAFTVRIETDNRVAANALAKDLSAYLTTAQLKRPNGTTVDFKSVTVSNPDSVTRRDAKKFISVSGEFNGTDTSTLVIVAQDSVKKEFNAKKLATYNLKTSNLVFDIGQEQENQDSFKTLLFAFPLLLVAIYVLLYIQFRSLLQPLLIFMAIPFSFFGITAGLWLTHNAFSFFTMLGFFALIGLSIKNTILLTDYANQAKRAGHGPGDSIAIALKERFRPLVATSVTAIVSLIPLYLSNPFWEGLAVTLMFGLLSSTLLVITVFPYYFLGVEYLRMRTSRKGFFAWLGLNLIVLAPIAFLVSPKVIGPAFLLLNFLLVLTKIARRKFN